MEKVDRRRLLKKTGLASLAAAVAPALTQVQIASAQTRPVRPPGRPALAHIIGVGTGTFQADLDGDDDIDGSYFGFDVRLERDGAASGYFVCAMAGQFDFLDLPAMVVYGPVTQGSITADERGTFGGVGSVDLGNDQVLHEVSYSVAVTGGGPGEGSLTLTVFGAFDGTPGDTIPGNGNYDLATEAVGAGHITIDVRHGRP